MTRAMETLERLRILGLTIRIFEQASGKHLTCYLFSAPQCNPADSGKTLSAASHCGHLAWCCCSYKNKKCWDRFNF